MILVKLFTWHNLMIKVHFNHGISQISLFVLQQNGKFGKMMEAFSGIQLHWVRLDLHHWCKLILRASRFLSKQITMLFQLKTIGITSTFLEGFLMLVIIHLFQSMFIQIWFLYLTFVAGKFLPILLINFSLLYHSLGNCILKKAQKEHKLTNSVSIQQLQQSTLLGILQWLGKSSAQLLDITWAVVIQQAFLILLS